MASPDVDSDELTFDGLDDYDDDDDHRRKLLLPNILKQLGTPVKVRSEPEPFEPIPLTDLSLKRSYDRY